MVEPVTSQSPTTPPGTATASTPRWLPLAMLLLLGNLWGGAFSLSKLAIEGGVPPLGYAFWQSLAPGIILLTLCRLRGLRLNLTRRSLKFYVVTGLLGLSLPNILFYFVIDHIPAGVMALVVTSAPLLTYIFALMFTMEIFAWRRMIGIGFGLAGALCLVLPRASLPSADMAPWVAVAFLTPAFYAINSIFSTRQRPPDSHSLGLACGMLFGAAALQAPIVIASGNFYPLSPPFAVPDFALLGQIVVSSLAYVLFFELLRLAGPVYFSQVGYIVTLTGLVWGMIVFDEAHSNWIYLATLLVLIGIGFVNIRRKLPKPES